MQLPTWMTNSVRQPSVGHAFVEFLDEESANKAVAAVFEDNDPRSEVCVVFFTLVGRW